MKSHSSTLLAEVRSFRQNHPDVRYVDLIALDIPGHFYGKRYPIDMLEKVAAGGPLKVPQNCVLLGAQGGLHPIGDYCFNDGDPDAPRCFYCNKRVSPSAPYTPPGSRGVYCNEVCAAAKREAMEAARRARVAGG